MKANLDAAGDWDHPRFGFDNYIVSNSKPSALAALINSNPSYRFWLVRLCHKPAAPDNH